MSSSGQSSQSPISQIADSIYNTISKTLNKDDLIPLLLELLSRVGEPAVLPTGGGWQLSIKKKEDSEEWLFTISHPQVVGKEKGVCTEFLISNHSKNAHPQTTPLVTMEPDLSWNIDLADPFPVTGLLFYGVPNLDFGKIFWLSDTMNLKTGKCFLTLNKTDGRVLYYENFAGYLFGYVALPKPLYGAVGIVTPFRPVNAIRMYDYGSFFNFFMSIIVPIYEKANDQLEALVNNLYSIPTKKV